MTIFSQSIGHIDERPWGRYEIIDQGEAFQVKRIEVNSGKRLSLQSHEHRKEYWIIISGRFKIQIDSAIDEYDPGDMVFIPIGAMHRPECISKEKGIFIEVQQGDDLSEEDIVRYEDDFGRGEGKLRTK